MAALAGGLYRLEVARLAAKQQIGVDLLGCYIIAHGPSMARLLDAARANIGLYLVLLNEKSCI